jgi:hypothetical protein
VATARRADRHAVARPTAGAPADFFDGVAWRAAQAEAAVRVEVEVEESMADAGARRGAGDGR